MCKACKASCEIECDFVQQEVEMATIPPDTVGRKFSALLGTFILQPNFVQECIRPMFLHSCLDKRAFFNGDP